MTCMMARENDSMTIKLWSSLRQVKKFTRKKGSGRLVFGAPTAIVGADVDDRDCEVERGR